MRRSRYNSDINSEMESKNPYKNLTELERGCWYRGRVIGFKYRADQRNPVVLVGHRVPKVIVNGCNEKVKKNDMIVFEITVVRGLYALAVFKEVFKS